MSSSRIIRGTKAKIFLYVSAILIITALIACYNNTLSQLEDMRKSNEICRQQEENLSTQLKVISDYKQRLEKSLKTEKAEHQQMKQTLETKLTDEKSKNEKMSNDAELKLSSLQQHYKLLQTKHDDLKEESSKIQKNQLEEINNLQAKLAELKQTLKKLEVSKENLQTQYDELKQHLQNEEESVKKYLLLKKEYDILSSKCSVDGNAADPKTNLSLSVKSVQNASLAMISNSSKDAVQIDLKEGPMVGMGVMPNPDENKKKVSTSSTPKSPLKPSQGNLNNARPLHLPTVTPEAKGKPNLVPENLGVAPDKKESQNEQPEVQNKGRVIKDDNIDNGAHEEFDVPNHEGLDFGEQPLKLDENKNVDKKHIDAMGARDKKQYDQDYRDLHDVQLEEQEDEDDPDGDYNHNAKQGEPAIRH